jgi:hypothetical protein
MIDACEQKVSDSDLARLYGISQATVLRRKTITRA